MTGMDKKTIWKNVCPNAHNFPPTIDFEPEITNAVENLNTINDFFNYFIDDLIIAMITQYTNRRLDIDTKKITENEIRGFIGLLLLFGVTKKHDIEIREIYKLESVHYMDWATVCMSRDRFLLISQKICFDDVETRACRFVASPKLHKINQIFDHLTSKFQSGSAFFNQLNQLNFLKKNVF